MTEKFKTIFLNMKKPAKPKIETNQKVATPVKKAEVKQQPLKIVAKAPVKKEIVSTVVPVVPMKKKEALKTTLLATIPVANKIAEKKIALPTKKDAKKVVPVKKQAPVSKKEVKPVKVAKTLTKPKDKFILTTLTEIAGKFYFGDNTPEKLSSSTKKAIVKEFVPDKFYQLMGIVEKSEYVVLLCKNQNDKNYNASFPVLLLTKEESDSLKRVKTVTNQLAVDSKVKIYNFHGKLESSNFYVVIPTWYNNRDKEGKFVKKSVKS